MVVFLGGSCLGRTYPGWELSRWDLSCVGIFFGGSFPGGNCPVGIIQVGVFMLPENFKNQTILLSRIYFTISSIIVSDLLLPYLK